jgi:hypothetical protein
VHCLLMDSFTAGGGCDGGGSGGLGHTLYPDAAARSGGWGPTCNPFPAGAPRVPPPPALAAVMAEPEPHRNQDGRVRKPTSTSVLAVVPHAIGAVTDAHMTVEGGTRYRCGAAHHRQRHLLRELGGELAAHPRRRGVPSVPFLATIRGQRVARRCFGDAGGSMPRLVPPTRHAAALLPHRLNFARVF